MRKGLSTTVPSNSSGPWWRSTWMECIYSSEDLRPLEVLVATVYADHAHDKRTSWVTGDRLRHRTKLSKDAAHRALKGLESKGYIVAIERKPRRPTTYALVVPEHRLSTGDVPVASTGDVPATSSLVRHTDQLVRETDTTSTGDVLHPSTYPSTSSHESAPIEADWLDDEPPPDDHDAVVAHECDFGWINNPDGTVTKCPTCKANKAAA